MAHLEFRRNLSNSNKAKKQGRSSEPTLLPANMKNYLSYFNAHTNVSSFLDKENRNDDHQNLFTPASNRKKDNSQSPFNRKFQQFSLEKDRKPHQKTPFRNAENLPSNISRFQEDQKPNRFLERSASSMGLTKSGDKKGFSLGKYSSEQSCLGQNNDTDKKFVPYFIDCFTKKNKTMTEALLNVQLSIITFKTFKRACMFTKVKNIDPKIPNQTPGRKTIIFDMDETLIHTNELITAGYEIKVPFRSLNGRIIYGYVCVRPYAKELLKRLSEHFDIIVFTAGSQPYADPILDHIDPQKVIQHRLYRESCTLVDSQVFVKDLRIIGRPLESLVLVDNAPHTYMLQLSNGIPILPYYKGKQDKQLYSLETYLMGLKDVEDVRKVNAETFQLQEYFRFDSRQKAVASLYGSHL